MQWFRGHRDGIALCGGVALPLAVAAVLVPFRESFAGPASALVLVAVVVAVAANGTRLAGFAAAISSSLWFDFFLTRPYERFAITQRLDIETAVSLFVVGVAVTELAARNRSNRRVAGEEADYVGVIYYLSELVAGGTPTEQIIDQANAELTNLLHLRSCRFATAPSSPTTGRIERDGTVVVGIVRWAAEQGGLPGPEIELPVHRRGHLRGRFVLEPTPGWPVSAKRLVVAVAIADQVGASLSAGLRSA
jgi:K+-sensing histidine kinase KdpD